MDSSDGLGLRVAHVGRLRQAHQLRERLKRHADVRLGVPSGHGPGHSCVRRLYARGVVRAVVRAVRARRHLGLDALVAKKERARRRGLYLGTGLGVG